MLQETVQFEGFYLGIIIYKYNINNFLYYENFKVLKRIQESFKRNKYTLTMLFIKNYKLNYKNEHENSIIILKLNLITTAKSSSSSSSSFHNEKLHMLSIQNFENETIIPFNTNDRKVLAKIEENDPLYQCLFL